MGANCGQLTERDYSVAYEAKSVRMLIAVTPKEKQRLETTAAKLGLQPGPLARALVLDGLERLRDESTRAAVDAARLESRGRRRRAGLASQQRTPDAGGGAQ